MHVKSREETNEVKTSDFHNCGHDDRFRVQFLLNESFKMHSQVFFEKSAVGDVFGFHIAYRPGDR